MGYLTTFEGAFELDKPLLPEHQQYLQEFRRTRRMKRDPVKAGMLPDPVREAVGLPIGEDAGFFVGGGGLAGQDRDDSILNYNRPPNGQPELWCHWEPNGEGTEIEWDGVEKFYAYEKWIEYLIQHFVVPWGYTLDGVVTWRGESPDDLGKIRIVDNAVTVMRGRIVYR